MAGPFGDETPGPAELLWGLTPALIEVARTGTERETRRTAMFRLVQSEDLPVVCFFEDGLLGRIR